MLLILLLCFIVDIECQGPPEAKYAMIFESMIYPVGEGSSDYIDTSRVICERYNETTSVMYGEVDFKKPMDSLIMDVILKKEASGKHETMFSHEICDLCNELGNSDSTYNKYTQYIKIPECPFEGIIHIDNLMVDLDEIEVSDQQCGLYLAELHMFRRTGDSCKNDREWLYTLKLDFSIERDG